MNTGLPPIEWDKQVQELGGSILQSQPWGKFQQALGRKVVWDKGDGWLWLGAIRKSRGIRYLICSYGPVASDPSSAEKALASLAAAGRQLGVDFVRIEPQFHVTQDQLRMLGAKQIHEFQAANTRILNLKKSEEDLRQDLASGHRNLINGTKRRGISFRQETNQKGLELLMQMLEDTAKRSGVTFFPKRYFESLMESLPTIIHLYVADAEGGPIAAALAYDWGGTRYYAHAGAFQDANRQVKASVSLVWQMIMDAKQAGQHSFDLWGVAPEGDAGHNLAGISKFKNAFGGHHVSYMGTWDIPLKPLKYTAYSAYRKLRGMDR